jgi:hypothetical protein
VCVVVVVVAAAGCVAGHYHRRCLLWEGLWLCVCVGVCM